jgi:hypothetical protein
MNIPRIGFQKATSNDNEFPSENNHDNPLYKNDLPPTTNIPANPTCTSKAPPKARTMTATRIPPKARIIPHGCSKTQLSQINYPNESPNSTKMTTLQISLT